jgi:hypothetical protein
VFLILYYLSLLPLCFFLSFPALQKFSFKYETTVATPGVVGKYYPADDVVTKKGPAPVRNAPKVRANLVPGAVVILLAGRFRGKRAVVLKKLPSGLLLVSGKYETTAYDDICVCFWERIGLHHRSQQPSQAQSATGHPKEQAWNTEPTQPLSSNDFNFLARQWNVLERSRENAIRGLTLACPQPLFAAGVLNRSARLFGSKRCVAEARFHCRLRG